MLKKILSLMLVCVLVMSLVPAVSAAPDYTNPGISTADVGDQTYYETEPNNDYRNANVLGNDYTVIGTMNGSDLDVYTFILTVATDVAIASAADLSTLTFSLRGASGNELAVADDNGYDSGLYLDSMGYALPAGTYYLMFQDKNSNTGSYAYMLYLLQQKHTHVWDAGFVITEPTYTTPGTKIYTCSSCYETTSETIPVIPHTHNYISTVVEPGCVDAGYTTHTCSICGGTYRDTYTDPLNHSWEEKVCQRCGVLFEDQFVDVPSDMYYFEPVMWAAENGITAGYGRFDTFNPDGDCTRAQVVTFLWRAAGKPEPDVSVNPFTDVKQTDYFYKAVLWAVSEDITVGTSATTFSPEASCTRAQVVTFLHRVDGESETTGNPNFDDVPANAYYYDSVAWSVENGISMGVSLREFWPDATCTRGQIATFLYRYYVQAYEPPSDEPTDEPSDEPSDEPVDQPTDEPADEPTDEPADQPTDEPVDQPTDEVQPENPSVEMTALYS